MTKNKVTKNALHRIVFFVGDDMMGRERVIDEYIREIKLLNENVEEEHYDSFSETMSDFITRAITPSLFGATRIFQIKHADKLTNDDIESILDVLRYELPDVYIIIEFDDAGKKKTKGVGLLKEMSLLAKKKPEICCKYELTQPPWYKIPEWLVENVPIILNRKISIDTANYLVDCVGTDLGDIYSELKKIDIFLTSGAPINNTAIENVTGSVRDMNPFELAIAVSNKDYNRVLEIIESLFASESYLPLCISSLFSHFWKLFRIRMFMLENKDIAERYLNKNLSYSQKNEVAYKIGVGAGLLRPTDSIKRVFPVVIKSGIIDQARNFKNNEIKKILLWLRDYDVGLKTGRTDTGKQSFQIFCYKIVRISEFSNV